MPRKRPPVWQQSWVWITGLTLAAAVFLWSVMQPPPPPPPPPADVEAAVMATFELPLSEKPSIAVAAFVDAGGGASDSQAAAIAREVTAELQRDGRLFVMHFDSSRQFDAATPAREIAAALGVRFVLQAEIDTRAAGIEFTPRLVDAVADTVQWDRALRIEPGDTANVPAAVAAATRAALGLEVDPAPTAATAIDPAAWDLYLAGRALAAERAAAANRRAAEAFAEALAIAPGFAAARIELGFTRYHAQQGFEADLTGPAIEGLQDEVLAALAQAPGSARGHELMSRLKMLDYTFFRAGRGERTNRELAMDYLAQAVELAPEDPDLMVYRARLHAFAPSRSYYAEEYAEEAMRRHPRHDWTYVLPLVQSLQLQMVYDRALAILETLIAGNPGVLRLHREAALVHGLKRDIEKGMAHMAIALEIDPRYGTGWETEDSIYEHPGNFQRDIEALRRVGLP